ncbi:MAG TPA: hypothetical protein VFO98_06595 [Marmoricola sp.]|nr:hypothetical protein [Marmoricola sp.]
MKGTTRLLAAAAAVVLATTGAQLGAVSSAWAGCGFGGGCGTEQPEGGDAYLPPSDKTVTASYNPPPRPAAPALSCSVYANGAGMGSACARPGPHGGGVVLQSLRERFGGQELQRCRYSEIPDGIPQPFNARPDEGHFMVLTCLDHINLDTWGGGGTKSLSMSLVFVPNGTDTEDKHNGITDFLWRVVEERANQLPVPFMVARPNPVPVVGVPTFFTFRWVDPGSGTIRAMGPYRDRPEGGPFLELRQRNGLVMRAQATRITIDPNQEGMDPVVCAPSTPYIPRAAPGDQPDGACAITFPRSSASARTYSTVPMPPDVEDAFYVSIDVEWRITYGQPGDMRQLGDGFTMRMRQVLPVQEIQAPNQPPAVIY